MNIRIRPQLCAVLMGVLAAAALGCSSSSGGDASHGSADGGAGAVDTDTSAAAGELSLSQNSFAPGAEMAGVGDGIAPAIMYPQCHPHLFARGVSYSLALNYHVNLFLRHIDDLLKVGKVIKKGTTVTWQYAAPDAAVEVTVNKTAPGQFTVSVGVAPAGESSFQTVVSGTVDRSNPMDVKKQLSFNFDTLHSVFPAGKDDKSAGQLALAVERTKNSDGTDKKRTVTYTMTKFVPVFGDPHGPRNGNTYFLQEPGVGGAMLYDASAVYFCPANPMMLPADTQALARWYVKSGTVMGRADAIATGGQFPSGNRWVGLSCRTVQMSAISSSPSADNGFWLMKEEDMTGATLKGAEVAMSDPNTSDPACDPALGAVTDLSDNKNDPTIGTSIPANAFPGEF